MDILFTESVFVGEIMWTRLISTVPRWAIYTIFAAGGLLILLCCLCVCIKCCCKGKKKKKKNEQIDLKAVNGKTTTALVSGRGQSIWYKFDWYTTQKHNVFYCFFISTELIITTHYRLHIKDGNNHWNVSRVTFQHAKVFLGFANPQEFLWKDLG